MPYTHIYVFMVCRQFFWLAISKTPKNKHHIKRVCRYMGQLHGRRTWIKIYIYGRPVGRLGFIFSRTQLYWFVVSYADFFFVWCFNSFRRANSSSRHETQNQIYIVNVTHLYWPHDDNRQHTRWALSRPVLWVFCIIYIKAELYGFYCMDEPN